MAPSTEFREPGHGHRGEERGRTFWARVKWVVKRAIFWSYERGSWQYDVIVVVILAFIFLTPMSWFHDRPRFQLTDLRHVQGIVEVSHSNRLWVYQIDARLVDSLGPLPLNEAVQQLLRQRIHPPFAIKSLQPILGKNEVILGYTVEIERQ